MTRLWEDHEKTTKKAMQICVHNPFCHGKTQENPKAQDTPEILFTL